MLKYISLCLLLFCLACQSGSQSVEDHAYTNKLIDENSPYLLQHAHNPVNWYPWGDEALEKAKAENKLLLISVGYSACHWCHVMEEESFEDTTVARIMNENFVSIKVDREERPDVDDVYMTACQLASDRSCGWPLNAFALPDGRPVWAGTYFPKKQWLEILEYFQKAFVEERDQLEAYADQLLQGIAQTNSLEFNSENVSLNLDDIASLAQTLKGQIDPKDGGRKGEPKFPMPIAYEFMLAWQALQDDKEALDLSLLTLNKIANGGIYDHLDGGFARYSTDGKWLVPHFEKMLYDNAQLISLYSKAYQLTGSSLYKERVEETIAFIDKEWTNSKGGFFSSLDADSEGEEGKFYIWSEAEIAEILGAGKQLDLFNAYYGVTKKGNWEEGNNILHVKEDLEKVAESQGLDPTEAKQLIDEAKSSLFEVRFKRIAPGKDDKVLTAWNALMLQAYVDAYKAFALPEYRERAIKNAEFLLQEMLREDGSLWRNYKDGKVKINGFLDDYAILGQALTGLYEISFDPKWLNYSQGLADYVLAHFYDENAGLFYYTSDLDPALVNRQRELEDNVIPSSNSITGRWLFRLGTYLYEEAYTEKARMTLNAISERMNGSEFPFNYANWSLLYLDFLKPPYEVAIVGPDWDNLRQEMQKQFLPNALYLGGDQEGDLELLKGKLVEGETFIYVCQNKVCKLPVQDVSQAISLMK